MPGSRMSLSVTHICPLLVCYFFLGGGVCLFCFLDLDLDIYVAEANR